MKRWMSACAVIGFSVITGCYRAGDPPSWWWNDPIDRSLRCPPRKAPRAARPGSDEGRRTPEAIQRDIRATYDTMQDCYENLLAVMPEARGLIQTRFAIAKDGSVPYACIDEASLNDNTMAKCVLRTFRGIEFGPSAGVVTVVYPLRFEPGQRNGAPRTRESIEATR